MLRDGDPVDLKYFLVAFLDMLGQRDHLRKLTGLPKNLRPDPETISVLKATLGALYGMRSCFQSYFETAREESEFLRSLPAGQRDAVRQLARANVIQYGFSDSFIVAVSLEGAYDDPTPINGVWSALFGACGIAVFSLACRHALRGGIDVGLGVQISENEIYGPALERAYTLESSWAEYPRILVGTELLAYLDEIVGAASSTPGHRAAILRAQSARRLIFTDSDGHAALDYLGPEFRSIAPEDDMPKTVRRAYEFVRAERARVVARGIEKLAERYDRLLGYFKLRAPLWGLSDD